MTSRLPATPMDALNISPALAVVVKTIHLAADIFGFWRSPSKKAAADFENMSLLDKIYWGYKSKKPVLRPCKDLDAGAIAEGHNKNISVPDDFVRRQTLTFAAVGDLIKVEGLEHSLDVLYKPVEDIIFSKDVVYGNLESQLTGQQLSSYTFSDKDAPPLCCSLEQYHALSRHKNRRFDVFHTATNHTMDMGEEGLDTTLERLALDGIIDLGTNRTPEEREQCRIIEKNGIKIGFVSATYGLNGKPLPEGREYSVNEVKFHPGGGRTGAADWSLLRMQIADCRRRQCDYIIASLHWGYEYECFPRGHQQHIARQLAEEGVDLIVAHHPHVLQPLELYRPRRDQLKVVPIAYSLGNLTSSFSSPHLVLSGVLNVTVSKGTLAGAPITLTEEAKLIPVVQTEASVEGKDILQILPLEALDERPGKDEKEKTYIRRLHRYARLVLGGDRRNGGE